jgi:DNA-binding CsgD family transcriptional regulator
VTVQKAAKVIPVPSLHFGIGPLDGRVLRVEVDSVRFGRRADNDVVIDDPHVSRVHAQLRREGDLLILTDLGSTSGTRVNDREVVGSSVVRHGDVVSFGPVEARFEDPAFPALGNEPTISFQIPKIQTGPHLSPRQTEVLELMAEGMTNSEIGAQLGVTERTVKAYAQELYDRLGVRNRAGAVAEAARHGIL